MIGYLTSLEEKEDKTIYNSMLEQLRASFISQFLQEASELSPPTLLPHPHQQRWYSVTVTQRLPLWGQLSGRPSLLSLAFFSLICVILALG